VPTTLIVNDTSSGLNWGSQATSAALRMMIEDTEYEISNTLYKMQLRQIEPNPYIKRSMHFSQMGEKFLENLKIVNIPGMYRSLNHEKDAVPKKYSQFNSYAETALNKDVYNKEIHAIQSSDVVIINAEGLLYKSSDRCTRSLFYIAYLASERLDTNCILTNVTFDPADDTVLEMAENVFPSIDQVIFREPTSARKWGHLCENSISAIDPVFYLSETPGNTDIMDSFKRGKIDIRPYASTTFDPNEPYITVAGNSIYADRSEYPRRAYKKLCKGLKKICPQILLVASARADERLLIPIAESLDIDIVGLNISIKDSLNLLSNASVYVGGRYHPAIFSLKGGVPVVPFAPNTHKMQGLLEGLDLQLDIFDPLKIENNIGEIVDLTSSYIDNATDFDHIPNMKKELSNMAFKNVQYIR